MRQLIFAFIFLFAFVTPQAQTINNQDPIQISVITIGPGASLNDAFGHNGFRVKTPRFDVIYDYGRFPFNDPNFYLNFARGKLIYSQGYSNYYDIINFYKSQDRTIKEQVLNLSLQQKLDLKNFLQKNALPENKDYLYDFFYDNCATKIRDVAEEVTSNGINFNSPETLTQKTFRDLIQDNLEWNSWGSVGIDIALGSVIDKNASAYEYMFLPEYIYQFFDLATLKNTNQKLVGHSRSVYTKKNPSPKSNFFSQPLFILGLLAICILFVSYSDFKNGKRSKWLDVVIFCITGLIGIFILLLWFATDHTATAQNYNLLWAFALNVIVIGQVLKSQPKSWFIRYLKFLIILLCLLAFHWIIGVQRYALALLPLLLAISVRYIFLINFFSKKQRQ